MQIELKAQAKVKELQDQVVALQVKVSELLDQIIKQSTELEQKRLRVIELEAQLKEKYEWQEDKKNYVIHHPIKNTVVYASKPENGRRHYLCMSCFNRNVKSVLQCHKSGLAYKIFKCSICSAEYKFPRDVET